MSTTTAPITVEQFLALPEDDSVRRELIGGEVITMARAGQQHEIVKSNFIHELAGFLKHNSIGRLMSETSYRLSPHDAPQPDVSVVLRGRLQPGGRSLISICPDIAVEVVSSETASFLQSKVKLYLQHGARAVWVAYPEQRIIHVYTAAGVSELSGDHPLEAPDILPGFSVPASAFFADL